MQQYTLKTNIMIRFLLIFIGFSFFNTLLMAQEEVGYYIKLKPEGKQIVQDIVCKGDSILIQNEIIKTLSGYFGFKG